MTLYREEDTDAPSVKSDSWERNLITSNPYSDHVLCWRSSYVYTAEMGGLLVRPRSWANS